MSTDGYYYLHTNGDLIWKRFRPEPSDFVRKVWVVDKSSRVTAWIIVIEALAMGAKRSRVEELAAKWGLTDEDARQFVGRSKDELNLFRDGNQWCATFGDFVNLEESQAGFGDTALQALAELARPGLIGAQQNG